MAPSSILTSLFLDYVAAVRVEANCLAGSFCAGALRPTPARASAHSEA